MTYTYCKGRALVELLYGSWFLAPDDQLVEKLVRNSGLMVGMAAGQSVTARSPQGERTFRLISTEELQSIAVPAQNT